MKNKTITDLIWVIKGTNKSHAMSEEWAETIDRLVEALELEIVLRKTAKAELEKTRGELRKMEVKATLANNLAKAVQGWLESMRHGTESTKELEVWGAFQDYRGLPRAYSCKYLGVDMPPEECPSDYWKESP